VADATVWAIVVAAGSGTRFGGAKQYAELGGCTILDRSVAAARDACGGVVVVVPPADVDRPVPGADRVVAGGATRSVSVRAGLAAVPDDAEVIVVHDAVRPLASPELWQAAIGAVRAGADGALCAVPVTDTIKRVDGTRIISTIPRDGLVAVQTPQAFRAGALRDAHAHSGEATDDGALVEALGGRVVVVAGSSANLKITHPDDLVVADALLRARP